MAENVPTAPPRRRSEPRPTLLSEETSCQQFFRLHTEAFQCTVRGQQLDAEGSREQAFNAYQKALQLIDKSIHLAHQGGFPPEEVNRIDDMVYKMRATRKEILERISDLQHSTEPNSQLPSYLAGPTTEATGGAAVAGGVPTGIQSPTNNDDPYRLPPPYNEAMAMARASSAPFGGLGTLYGNLNSALEEIASQQAALANPLPVNAQEVFSIANNVQIYFINSNENVSAPSYPSFLRVVIIQHDETLPADGQTPAFLQVGDWTYPLIPQRSPILRSAEGIYIFPDFSSNAPGSSVGLILPGELSPGQKQALEEVLLQLIGLTHFPEPGHTERVSSEEAVGGVPLVKFARDAPERPPQPAPASSPISESERLSTKIAAGLITGAEAISKSLAYGAVKTSHYLDKGTTFLQSKMDPVQQKPIINPQVKTGVKTAKNITGKAVQVSGFLVNQLGKATLALGLQLAPHVHKAGTKLIARTTNSNEVEANRKVDQVFEVTSGAVVGFGTVYSGLEEAAKVLATSISNNTVQMIHHRYGEEAGQLAGEAAETAGNTAMTAWNAKSLGPKSVAKKAAKDTGKVVLKNYEEKKKSPGGGSGGGSGPGSGSNSSPVEGPSTAKN